MVFKFKVFVYVFGVGMIKFIKFCGKVDYIEFGYEVGIKVFFDVGIIYDDVDNGVVCFCYGDFIFG